MTNKEFVIIGGSIAGFSAIKAIREEDSSSQILWITNEDRIPYKRTQINKNIFNGFEKEAFALVDHDWLVENHIELLYDEVTLIDSLKKELTFKHRGKLRYNKLIICTGSSPRKLKVDGLESEFIHYIHTARQAENIIRNSSKSKDYLIVGAGVEGIETAEQLIKMGKNVTLIEKENRVMKRFFTKKYSEFMQGILHENKVELILNLKHIEFIEEENNQIYLSLDGKVRKFDFIISSIGYSPNSQLTLKTDINKKRGILVDEFLQTSIQDIYAAGDVAEHLNSTSTGLWHAAEKQGFVAGKNAAGVATTFFLEPYRMKTEVFNNFFFSVYPNSSNYNLITEENAEITRDLYFEDDKLVALLMKNDKERAKIYQKALMEGWSLEKIHKELPL